MLSASSRKLLARSWRLLPLVALALAPACTTDIGGDDDEHEDEAMGSSSEAIVSSVDCKTTKMAAYDHGSPFTIDVITIGGKRVSKPTGHAFLKMQKAAHAAGVGLTINSGFRTMDEQKYFYNCYQTKKCNNGNLAAKPGYSNHQSGRALDLSTSTWLANNAGKFGFKRTVAGEPWHYEFSGADPGGPCSAGASSSSSSSSSGGSTPPDEEASSSSSSSGSAGTGKACASDGQCNPGNDGSGLICTGGQCVDGCRSNAQCPGSTTCKSGKCQ